MSLSAVDDFLAVTYLMKILAGIGGEAALFLVMRTC